jgi:hypothetical protein
MRCPRTCLTGALGGQQSRPTHGSLAAAGCSWTVRTPAVPAASAKMSAAARMIFFMAISWKVYQLTMQFLCEPPPKDVMVIT